MFSKTTTNLILTWLIFLYFVLFPFGQIIKFVFNPTDIVLLIIFVVALVNKFLKISKQTIFLFVILSLGYAIYFYFFPGLTNGVLYLGRLTVYFSFALVLKKLIREKVLKKDLLLKSLMLVGLVVAIFGIIQYLFLPDLRDLYYLGWDDHYYRLVSTFLDPAFTAILLVLSFIVSAEFFIKTKNKIYLLSSAIFFISIGLTFSRVGMFVLLLSILLLARNMIFKNAKYILLVILSFLLLLFMLPKPGGEGVNLFRTNSLFLKLDNLKESTKIISVSPLFGVGFNNVCSIKQNLFSINLGENLHSCSGLDNSILFLISTTGFLGLIYFLDKFIRIYKNTTKDFSGQIFLISSLAIFIHGQFTNTFFYPWVMGWFAVLYATSRKDYGE